MDEREGRAHFRRTDRPSIEVGVAFRREGSRRFHPGVTRDLGLAGAFIETDVTVEVSEPLVVELSVPSAWDPIVLKGVVRWTRSAGADAGFGLDFEPPEGPAARALQELLQAGRLEER